MTRPYGQSTSLPFIIAYSYMLNGEDYVVQFEKKMMDYLQRLVNDLDRRIKRAKERLEAKPSDEVLAMMKPNKDENEERIVKLELQLKDLLDRMEKFGEEGKVYEAQQLDCESDRLRRDIDRIKQVYFDSLSVGNKPDV